MNDIAEAFSSLFMGSELAFGKTLISGRNNLGKVETRSWTEKRAVTIEDWIAHLKGQNGIGIIPINSFNNVHWGAIDVDIYGIDLVEINRMVQEQQLPLIPCSSKSGGAHLFLFLTEWVPAQIMLEKLDAIAALLGFGTCEIFPKQTTIRVVDEAPDYGNWINMPYFGGNTRLGMSPEGNVLGTPQAFLEHARTRRLTRYQLENLRIAEITSRNLPEGPPCLNILWNNTCHEGHRNNLLANTIVYLKKAHPHDWESRIEEFNRKLTNPIPDVELQNLKKSYKKKEYRYKCQEQPLRAYCNATECKKRAHGISDSGPLPNARSLTKVNTEPPIWYLDIPDTADKIHRLSLTTEELMSPRLFQKKCLETLNIMPALKKQEEWDDLIRQRLQHLAIIEMPPDATPKGQFEELFDQWLSNNHSDDGWDALHRDLAYKEGSHYHFRLASLTEWLKRKGFKSMSERDMYAILQSAGAESARTRISGKLTRHWTIPVDWSGTGEVGPLDTHNPEIPY